MAFLVKPLILFEDEHLLVVNKPAGMNTHSPSPFAGEGLYEWLKHRETLWSKLAIIHRLDKETSGVMVFGKTGTANRSLTEQFTQHTVRKKYRLLTDRAVTFEKLTTVSTLVRTGEKYSSRPLHVGADKAETRFRFVEGKTGDYGCVENASLFEAEPVTGRTHQIRVHAAAEGFPILGDVLYGGTASARVYLHSAELKLKHPGTGMEMSFSAPEDFSADARLELRERLLSAESSETNAYRLVHGAADGWPGWYVERLGEYLLSQGEQTLSATQAVELRRLQEIHGARGAYHKILTRQVRGASVSQTSPQRVLGEAAPGVIQIIENGVRFELSFNEGYSVGLFLDQRDNRRRLLTDHVAADFKVFANGPADAEALNTFAYTCGFSVCAAKAGARVTSLDLSKKYLEWGKRNFALNQLDADAHDFIYGEVFDWLRRLAKKERVFDLVLLDPPTFSQSKTAGVFQAEKDYGRLVKAALPVLKPGGVLFASTNAARLEPEAFLEKISAGIHSAGRKILQQHYAPQTPDFPVSRDEPAYLKTVWIKIA